VRRMGSMGVRVTLGALAVVGLLIAWRTGVRAGGRAPRPGWMSEESAPEIGSESYAAGARRCDQRLAEAGAALRARPGDASLLFRLARYHWQRAQLLALDAYGGIPTTAHTLESESEADYRAWMRTALARDPDGDLRESARLTRRALANERAPNRRWWLLRHLARTECARGRHHAELEALEEGAALRPEDPDVLQRLARAQEETGDPLAQERTLERAWRAARARGGEVTWGNEPGARHVWFSPAADGDAWMEGLCLH
jgi:tetratricopeptide (TPR) repeat protein